MAKWNGFPGALSEVERLRVELERARKERDEAIRRRDAWKAKAGGYDELAAAVRAKLKDEPATLSRVLLKAGLIEAEARADRLQAERDELAARLQAVQQAERAYTAAKLTEAARMRKGEAL